MLLPVCSVPWAVDGAGAIVCPGVVSSVDAPVGWSLEPADVSQILTATLILFAAVLAVRVVVRLLLQSPGRQ